MWFRVDDNLDFHPKTLEAGNEAMGLWVRAGAYAGRLLTDGFVRHDVVEAIGGRRADVLADRLVNARGAGDTGLWVPVPGGFQFHEWIERQPTAEDVKRVAEEKGTAGLRGNHLRWHKRRGVFAPDCKWCQEER